MALCAEICVSQGVEIWQVAEGTGMGQFGEGDAQGGPYGSLQLPEGCGEVGVDLCSQVTSIG